jgi:hypothetical protein
MRYVTVEDIMILNVLKSVFSQIFKTNSIYLNRLRYAVTESYIILRDSTSVGPQRTVTIMLFTAETEMRLERNLRSVTFGQEQKMV